MKKILAFACVAALSTSLFAADAAALFKAKCAGCHGADGSKAMPAMGMPAINTTEAKGLGATGIANVIDKGKGKMPAFSGKISPEDANAIAAYVLTLK